MYSATLRVHSLNQQHTLIMIIATIQTLVDANHVGVAVILSQGGRPVAYASRTLTDVETRYSQTESEAVAVVWGWEHFNIYTERAACTVITDHKSLLGIWQKSNSPLRIARWTLRVQHYDIRLEYRHGLNNPADYLSRHPAQERIEWFRLHYKIVLSSFHTKAIEASVRQRCSSGAKKTRQ